MKIIEPRIPCGSCCGSGVRADVFASWWKFWATVPCWSCRGVGYAYCLEPGDPGYQDPKSLPPLWTDKWLGRLNDLDAPETAIDKATVDDNGVVCLRFAGCGKVGLIECHGNGRIMRNVGDHLCMSGMWITDIAEREMEKVAVELGYRKPDPVVAELVPVIQR